jgi:phosphate transport system substrate-binding protein
VSPIAVVYNVKGVDNLQLSAATIGKIFNEKITTWNDPAIAAENPDAKLPATKISPVHRSDESGTTENFTEYLSEVDPQGWPYEVSGDWPVEGGEAAQGTSGVVEAVAAGDGAIGYADASQAGELGVATIKVGSEYEEPTPEAAAAILEESPEAEDAAKTPYMFPFELDRKTETSGTYPVVLVSYLIACTEYGSADEAGLVKSYLEYVISPEGQEAAASNAGSAPLSSALTQKIAPAIAAIKG